MLFVPATMIMIFEILIGKKMVILFEISNTLFELAEFIAFYYFFKKCLQNKKFQKIFRIFFIVLVLSIVTFFTRLTFPNYTIYNIRKHSLIINVIEFYFILAMCLAYFYELLTDVPEMNLLKRPSFFIVTSTFFYTALFIPFFVLADDILHTTGKSFYFILFAWHYLLLTIVLLSISKAFLCKTPITT